MNFSEQPPSKQWAALKYRGETLAEVWFKPEDEPAGLMFRIPQKSFQIAGVGQRLTAESLLKAVGIPLEEVESWHPDAAEMNSNLAQPLSPPPLDTDYLHLHICLKAPEGTIPFEVPQSDPTPTPLAAEIPEATWQDLETRWKTILGLEASLETLRMSMESLRAEMDGSARRMLTTEEKVHALNSYVLAWNKAKTRVQHAVPKVREFIHRSTWATGTPERKKLEELFKNYIQPRIPFPEMDKIVEQLEHLLKDRQVLSAQGVSVQQECAGISASLQEALRALQTNATTNATRKRGAMRGKSL